MNPGRPQFFSIWRLHLPLPAWVSILHRASGVLLFLALPLALYLLARSLASAQGYAQVQDWLAAPPARLLAFLLLWAGLHHLLAGLRHLAQDLGLGLAWPAARRSAALVMLLALVLSLSLALV